MDDSDLVRRARDGDLDAYAELVRRYERRVRGVLARLLDDERDIEEATQDTFVQAWRSLDRFRGDAAVFTWIYRIAANEALQRRRRKRLAENPLDERDAVREVDGDLHRALLVELRALPWELRSAVVLRDVEGLSSEEAAAVLEITVASLKSRLHRGRLALRDALESG